MSAAAAADQPQATDLLRAAPLDGSALQRRRATAARTRPARAPLRTWLHRRGSKLGSWKMRAS